MKSYLRFLSRNKLYTAIEVVGLSISLAFVIIMSCFVWQNMSVNRHYPDQDRMYAIGGEGDVMSNMVMTQTMMDAIPEIEDGTTLKVLSMYPQSSVEGSDIGQGFFMGVYKEFFDLFPTEFMYGHVESFNDLGNAIVTESIADQFGGADIIGKKLLFEGEHEFTIAAVVEDFNNTIFSNAQVILNLNGPAFNSQYGYDLHGSSSGTISIIKVKKGTDENELLEKMESVYEADISADRRRDSYLSLTRLDRIYTSDNNDGDYTGFKKGNAGMMTAFSIIVVFLLISAIFNYINLSTALAGRRSKEIATRMLLGEDRREVFVRNILESLGFMAACMCFAFIIASLCLPYVNDLLNSPIPVRIRLSHGYIYMYMLILGVAALLCGIVPALISFRFKPIEIIKGHYRYQSKRAFSKVFIIIQNTIAIIIIAVTLVMDAQIRHMIDMPLNASVDNLYYASPYSADFEKQLTELPNAADFGRASGRPGQSSGTYGFLLNNDINKQVTMDVCECDSKAFELYGFRIVKDYGVPNGEGAWLTESAARKLEIDPENPLFPQLNAWVINNAPIAGIIEDVPLSSALNLNPDAAGIVLVGPQDPEWAAYVVKLKDTSREKILELDRLCKEELLRVHGPNAPVSPGFFPEMIEKAYEPIRKQAKMVTLFMIVALMLSALGQIAMSTYYATEKEKEIGIRKVFGGTVRSESIRNILEYMLYCLIATAIAVPLSVWAAERYLETFIYKMQQKGWIFIVAALAVFAISLASVLWQTLRAARTNPAEALKKE